jgi:hypothetical protein
MKRRRENRGGALQASDRRGMAPQRRANTQFRGNCFLKCVPRGSRRLVSQTVAPEMRHYSAWPPRIYYQSAIQSPRLSRLRSHRSCRATTLDVARSQAAAVGGALNRIARDLRIAAESGLSMTPCLLPRNLTSGANQGERRHRNSQKPNSQPTCLPSRNQNPAIVWLLGFHTI